MTSTQLETLRWQFDLTRMLADYHLPALTDEACLWEPVPGSWTVRLSTDGRWRPDWSEPEPDPAPTTTIGWLSWHLIWWWSGVLAALRNEAPSLRADVYWPGSAEGVRDQFSTLAKAWSDEMNHLTDADLNRPFAYPWPEPRPLSHALAWANSELMKNVAEIGCMRHLYEAARRRMPTEQNRGGI